MKTIRHWWIQKPIRTNCPLEVNGAVFEEFEPTIMERNCEWIKVFSSDDFHLKAGMGITRYSQVCKEKSELESLVQRQAELLERCQEFICCIRSEVSITTKDFEFSSEILKDLEALGEEWER